MNPLGHKEEFSDRVERNARVLFPSTTPTPRTEKEDGGAHTPAVYSWRPIDSTQSELWINDNKTCILAFYENDPSVGIRCDQHAAEAEMRQVEKLLNAHADLVAHNEALRGALEKSRDEHLAQARLWDSVDDPENRNYHQKQADEETAALTTTSPAKA